MNYGFSMSGFEVEKFVPQVAFALEKRAELISRKKYPELWKKKDNINAKKNPIQEEQGKQRIQIRFAGIVCLIMGIILVVPGFVNPSELLLPLITGLFGIIMGVRSLFRSGKNTSLFNRPARQLLKHENEVLKDKIVTVGFFEDRMEIPTVSVKTGTMKSEIVSYSDFEYFFEMQDLFVVTYKENVLVIKKQDLVAKTVEEFCEFVSDKVECIKV